MKKLLLPLVALTTLPVFAGVEKNTYDPAQGLECTNVYNISRTLNLEDFNAAPFAEFNNKTRSMVAKDGKLYIAHSRTMIIGDEDSNDYAHLIVYDQYTGKFIEQVQLTVGGEPVSGLLCANQLGVDDFGNFWFMGLVGNSALTPWKLYHIKDVKTGECELIASLKVPDDESEAFGRHDYFDLVGDVTGQKAGTVVMSPVASGSDNWVVGFSRDQGSDDWGPHMDGGGYYASPMSETYPADKTSWNGAPYVRIVRDEDHSGSLFYIDGFETYPALYNIEGTMLDSFIPCVELVPNANANGCMEFSVAGVDLFAYAFTDYDKGVGSQIRITRFGEGQQFEGMTHAWDLPKDGLGTLSDTGTRMFAICPTNVTDENGKEGCYLSTYKCNNGLATYLIAEPGFKAGVSDVIADNDANAPVEYFNLNGVRIDNPAAGGIYVRRQGSEVSKIIIK